MLGYLFAFWLGTRMSGTKTVMVDEKGEPIGPNDERYQRLMDMTGPTGVDCLFGPTGIGPSGV